MSGQYYFVIVGLKDNPLFELEHSSNNQARDIKRDEHRHLNQFVAHAALDLVDEQMWSTNNMYLRTVDRFNEWIVSAFVTAGRLRFLILHDSKNEDGIRHFMQEMYEAYAKLALNPFHDPQKPIVSRAFKNKALACAKRYLT